MDGTVCASCPSRADCRHAIEPLPDRDHEQAYRLFTSCLTQVRTSFGGVVGLDYNAVWLVSGALGVEMDEWMLNALQSLERAYLDDMARRMDKDGGMDARNGSAG